MRAIKDTYDSATLFNPDCGNAHKDNLAIARLKRLARQKQYGRCKDYSDDDANSLTVCVVDYLNFMQHHAERVAVTGIPTIRNGKIEWRRSHMNRGTSDVHSIIASRACMLEIKHGADEMSSEQKEYQKKVEAAGGVYIVVRTFEDFLNWYDNFIASIKEADNE